MELKITNGNTGYALALEMTQIDLGLMLQGHPRAVSINHDGKIFHLLVGIGGNENEMGPKKGYPGVNLAGEHVSNNLLPD